MCLGNISKYFTINNMKKNRIKRNDILDIRKYLMIGKQRKIMFGLIREMLIE